MLSLVDEAAREKILVKDGNDYDFFLGKGIVDFTHFILFRMYNWKKLYGATEGEGEEEDQPANDEPNDLQGTTSEKAPNKEEVKEDDC